MEKVKAVNVSRKMLRLEFNRCDPEFIRDVCHARCCESSVSPTRTIITIHPSEIKKITDIGGVVENGLLLPRPGERKCPFKTQDNLCSIHFTQNKPFRCIASPFTLNHNDTLIIRNRYRLLKCFKAGKKLPAYVAFRASLDLIFGEEAEKVCFLASKGHDKIGAIMSRDAYLMLKENDTIKKEWSKNNDHSKN